MSGALRRPAAHQARGAPEFDDDDALAVGDGLTDDECDDEEEEEEYDEDAEYEEEEGEEEEEYEDEEDAEPSLDTYLFEYEAWKVDSLGKDTTITAMCASDRAVAIGTSTGEIMLLSADGACELNTGKRLKGHDSAINDICVDENCDYVGSVSVGGSVAIESTTGKDYYHQHFDRPLSTLTLHPQYKSHDDKPFVCAGFEGKVILCNRGFFFGKRQTKVIDEKDGRVFRARWNSNGHTLAWATDYSIVLANMKNNKVFWRESRTSEAMRADLFSCNIFWESETRLVVGWGNQVFTIEVRESAFGSASAEILYYVRTDHPLVLCGLQPYDQSHFAAMLTTSTDGWVPSVQISVMERTLGTQLNEDQLAPRSRAPLANKCVFLQTTDDRGPEFATYLMVIGGSEHIRVRRVNDDDRVGFLVRNEMLEDAFKFITDPTRTFHKWKRDDVGKKYLDDLFDRAEYGKLAKVLPDVIGTDPALAPRRWEHWVNLFLEKDKGLLLLPYIPRQSRERPGRGPLVQLPHEVYEVLLKYALERDISAFKQYVTVFKGLYNAKPVCNIANLRLKHMRTQAGASAQHIQMMGECVGLLLEEQSRFDEAFMVLKDVRNSKEIFAFIQRHHLEREAIDQLTFLFNKSRENTLALLIEAAAEPESDSGPLAPVKVLAKIRGNPVFQWDYFCYLAALLDRANAPARVAALPPLPTFNVTGAPPRTSATLDPEDADVQSGRLVKLVREFFPDLMQRCIDYNPEDFSSFLRSFSDCGDNKETLQVCVAHGMYEEAALLMARTGAKRDAIQMLVRKLMSVPKAIAFIREWEDPEGELFATLVATALEVDKKLDGREAMKLFEHKTRERDTWVGLASRYDVELQMLMNYNNAVTDNAPLPNPVKVPINLLESLLAATAENQELAGVDPIYLIHKLPLNSHIPNLAERLTSIATNKKSHSRLVETIISVLNGDIHTAAVARARLSKRAVRVVSHRDPCTRCQQHLAVTTTNVVTFRCGHMMHCRCALEEMCDLGAVRLPADVASDPVGFERTANDFFRGGGRSLTPASRSEGGFPFCSQCGSR